MSSAARLSRSVPTAGAVATARRAGPDRSRLRVVPPVVRTRRRVPFVALVSILLLGGVVGLLLFNTSMQQASFTATQLETQAAALDARRQTLATQLDDLSKPERLAALACAAGMVPGPSAAFLDVDTGRVTGEPVAAAAAPCGAAALSGAARPPRADGRG